MKKTTNEEQKEKKQELEEEVLLVRRVSKKTPGGNYINFSALVAVGDKKGQVGLGLARGLEVPQAIKKAANKAKKQMIKIPLYRSTLPHELRIKYKAASLILKPAPEGVGLKVGGVIRSILSLAGVKNASGKILRSRNQITNAYAIIEGLKKLKIKS